MTAIMAKATGMITSRELVIQFVIYPQSGKVMAILVRDVRRYEHYNHMRIRVSSCVSPEQAFGILCRITIVSEDLDRSRSPYNPSPYLKTSVHLYAPKLAISALCRESGH